MQCGAVCCSVVHGGAVCQHLQPYEMAPAVDIPNAAFAVCCSMLQCVAVCYTVLQCVAVCCSVLHCVAVCCSVLECVTLCCSVLQCVCT